MSIYSVYKHYEIIVILYVDLDAADYDVNATNAVDIDGAATEHVDDVVAKNIVGAIDNIHAKEVLLVPVCAIAFINNCDASNHVNFDANDDVDVVATNAVDRDDAAAYFNAKNTVGAIDDVDAKEVLLVPFYAFDSYLYFSVDYLMEIFLPIRK